MKIRENWSIWFLRILMYPGSWKLDKIEESYFWEFSCTESWKFDKIEESYFWEFSCTGGHENARKLKHMIFENFNVPWVMKMSENWSVRLLRILMYPGSWKFDKIEASLFLWSFMYQGSWKCEKTEAYDLWEFQCTVMKMWENWSLWLLRILMGHENSQK